MALHFSGRDKDGTHRISGSSGHGGNIRGARADSVWFDDYEEVMHPISMNIDFHMGGYDYVGETVFAFSGSVLDTDLNSIAVYRNGASVDEDGYSINFNSNSLTINSPITSTDDSLEIRAKRCHRSRYAEALHDVLILKTSEHLPFDELSKLHPSLGETIDAQRIMKYEENKRIFERIKHPFNVLQVVSYRVEPNGIYASLKSY